MIQQLKRRLGFAYLGRERDLSNKILTDSTSSLINKVFVLSSGYRFYLIKVTLRSRTQTLYKLSGGGKINEKFIHELNGEHRILIPTDDDTANRLRDMVDEYTQSNR